MFIDIDAISLDGNAEYEIDFLGRIESWVKFHTGFVEKQKLLRYIVVLYSHDSFLNMRNPIPLADRKQRALDFAEIEESDEVTNGLLLLEDDIVLKMIQDFLIAQRNHLWTEIVTTEQQYEEAVRLRLQPIKNNGKDKEQLEAANKKRALRIDCKEMTGDLDTFYRKFYAGHDDVRDRVRKRATSLESLAKSTKNV